MNALLDEVVRCAAAAAPLYAALPAARRAAFLDACAAAVDALGDRLTETAMRETHLPAARLESERGRTVGQLRMFAALVREGSWVDARIDTGVPDARRMLEPVGVVAVFAPGNFPLAFSVAGGDTASALAAGCPVVFKAHSAHPRTSDLVAGAMARAVAEAGVPAAAFSLVHTPSREVNLELVRHPSVAAVGFTGSQRGGRALFDAAAAREHPIPVFAEMGSVNPVVLLPGAVRDNAEAIAGGLHQSVTMGVGQFCTNPGVAFALADEYTERLLAALAGRMAATPPQPMLTAGIAEAYARRLAELRGAAEVETLVAVNAGPGEGGAALLRITAAAALARPELLDECFGPSTVVVAGETIEHLTEVLRSMPGQLTATVHMSDSDADTARALLPLLRRRAGRVVFNGFPTGVAVCPAMQHGGPYPASTDGRFTSVGTAAILRWARPVCYQDAPAALLPPELLDENPLGIWRTVSGKLTREPLR